MLLFLGDDNIEMSDQAFRYLTSDEMKIQQDDSVQPTKVFYQHLLFS